MSHVAVIKTEIKSLEALKAACKRIGLEFREGQTTYRWYNRWMNDYSAEDAAYKNGLRPENYGKDAIHAIGIPGDDTAYEIGVLQNTNLDGEPIDGFKLVWDFFDHRIKDAVGGEKAAKLVTAYTAEAFREEAAQQGYSVTETTDQNGYLVLEALDYAAA